MVPPLPSPADPADARSFAATVAHQLRAPLVNQQAFAADCAQVADELRILFEEPETPAALRERGLALLNGTHADALAGLERVGVQMHRLIDALVRLEGFGDRNVARQAVDLQVLVGNVLESFASPLREGGVSVVLGELPSIWGDPLAIEQIFINLIDNALHALQSADRHCRTLEIGALSPAQSAAASASAAAVAGASRCPAASVGKTLVLFVRDSGAGVTPELCATLFAPFMRGPQARHPGNGLGLAIVRAAVEAQGGAVWMESAEGVGTTVWLQFPAEPPAAAARSVAHSP